MSHTNNNTPQILSVYNSLSFVTDETWWDDKERSNTEEDFDLGFTYALAFMEIKIHNNLSKDIQITAFNKVIAAMSEDHGHLECGFKAVLDMVDHICPHLLRA